MKEEKRNLSLNNIRLKTTQPLRSFSYNRSTQYIKVIHLKH